ncbi:unnamed protein product [Blepharisma stoltei]|uniref:RING-type domain-containing protein n=1 Tax=Blepharisma stoltei TaxID=1481888 RepID=A0AAU9KBH8_9CILI|nr:unnamed protein product [Blepharisma stoltei]
MSEFLCSFEGCQGNVEAKCLCITPALMFCAEHLGKHLASSQGNHNFEKLFYDPYRQAKIDVLLYLKSKVEDLNNLKKSVIREVLSGICMLNNNLQEYIGKINKEIAAFKDDISQTIQSLENNIITTTLEYLKLPSTEAVDYAKANLKSEFLNIKCEEIISEIYKKNGWAKLIKLEESLKKNKTIELKLLDTKESMDNLLQKTLKEYEELKQLYGEAKNQEFEQTKKIESYEIANKKSQRTYDELYKEKENLSLRFNMYIQNARPCRRCLTVYDKNQLLTKWCDCKVCMYCKSVTEHASTCEFCHKQKPNPECKLQ